jgi:hypothetical protein
MTKDSEPNGGKHSPITGRNKKRVSEEQEDPKHNFKGYTTEVTYSESCYSNFKKCVFRIVRTESKVCFNAIYLEIPHGL